jgi:hypothetical protein
MKGGSMKTSEFKKTVEENGYKLSELKHILRIEFGDDILAVVSKVWSAEVNFNGYVPRNLAIDILDYAYTPLEQREEKKYYLRLPSCFDGTYPYYLFYHRELSLAYQIVFKVKGGDEDYTFTQKEIDEMPFDTSFFIKEEV